MGSKKMVSVNLFAEKEWVYRYSEQTYGHSGDERVEEMEKVAWTHIHYHV